MKAQSQKVRRHATDRTHRGFSLIELMIALTLGLIVIAGLGQLYVGGRSANRIIDNTSILNENGRFAAEYFARATRLAGYFSCGGSNARIANAVAGESFWFDYQRGIEGFDVGTDTLPTAISSLATVKSGTDVLVVRYSNIRQTLRFDEDDFDGAQHKITFDTPHFFRTGDVAVINDAACSQTTFFQVTGGQNGSGQYNITFALDTSVEPGNCTTDLAGEYDCDILLSNDVDQPLEDQEFEPADLNKFTTQAYFIANDSSGCAETATSCLALQGCPTLFTAGTETFFNGSVAPSIVPVLRNVSNMQLEFGVCLDADNDGVCDLKDNTPEVQAYESAATVTLGNDWDKVLSVRISLEIVSNDCASKTFTTSIALRNASAALARAGRPMMY